MKRGENKEIHKKRRWKEAKTKKYIRKAKRRENKEIHKTMDGVLDEKKRKQRNT